MRRLSYLIVFTLLVFSSDIFAQTWVQQTNPVSGRNINSAWAVDTSICWMCGATLNPDLGYVIKTTNAGIVWTNATSNIPSSTIGLDAICGISALEAWVGASNGSVYHTINGGINWAQVTMPLPYTPFVDAIHFFNQNTGFILGDPLTTTWCYYWTTNAGVNWTSHGPSFAGSEAGWNNGYTAIDTGHIWWGTNNTRIYYGGLRSTFTSAGTIGICSYGLAFPNANTGVAIMSTLTNNPLANNISTNGGLTWATGYTPANVQFGMKCIPGFPYVWSCGGSATGGVIMFSTNYGVNWTTQFTMSQVGKCLTLATVNRGWVGCETGLIYRYTGILSEVNNINTTVPDNFVLEQNYPNPFNPSTKIKFDIPDRFPIETFGNDKVVLKIYDILGKEITTLVKESLNPGSYEVTFDANKLSSGIYFYRLSAGNFMQTKRMILIK